ncbi:hypothetical protein BOX30_06085 [Leptospirillum ferriphilum]|nr:hypothetical protein BOX30_06085 [Leptospirillum ferriphilum]
MNLSKELKEARKRSGMTQAVLAKRSGISRTALGSIEKGKTNMSIETFIGLLDALGMTLKIVKKPVERGRVEGRFPNFEELRKMRLAGEI